LAHKGVAFKQSFHGLANENIYGIARVRSMPSLQGGSRQNNIS
jgi:hypothetical protein